MYLNITAIIFVILVRTREYRRWYLKLIVWTILPVRAHIVTKSFFFLL